MRQEYKSLFNKCLWMGMLFGALTGIFVGILSIKINYFPLKINNILLIPLYHILIYVTVGFLIGITSFVVIWIFLRLLSTFMPKILRYVNILLPASFLVLFALFNMRLLLLFPSQKVKNTIKFEYGYHKPSNSNATKFIENTELFIGNKPHIKTVIIGLDAASYTVIDTLISENLLPNIKNLIDNGVRANIKTMTPTRSPVIWTSIATGKLPEEHGIWDFVLSKMPGTSFTRGRYKYPYASGMERLSTFLSDISFIPNIPYTSNLRKVKAFWNILSEFKRPVGIIGWYASFPAEAVNGVMVSDGYFFSKRYEDEKIMQTLTYPPALVDEINSLREQGKEITDEQLIAKFNISAKSWQKIKASKHFDNISYLLRLTLKRDERTVLITQEILNKYSMEKIDLLSVYFKSLDEVSHATCEDNYDELQSPEEDYPICWENIKSAYMMADARIGEILRYVQNNAAIMIISDHGFSYGRILGESKVGHWHGQDGVFILSGPNIKRNYQISDVTILDVLPTLLYMQNLPVAADMHGQVVLSAFENHFLDTHPVNYIQSYETENDFAEKPVQTKMSKEIEKKLKSLGYIK